MLHFRRSVLSQTLLVTGALAAAANLASAQAKKPLRIPHRAGGADTVASTEPGKILLYLNPGTPAAEATRVGNSVQAASVTPMALDDLYMVTLNPNKQDKASVAAAVAQLKLDGVVRFVKASPRYVAHKASGSNTAEPNDPRYKTGEQYGLKLINMPQAWTLQKGSLATTVAVIDSGFEPTHEDAPNFSPGSFDFADNDADINADGVGGEPTHGIFTSGVMSAHTNNSKGIAAVIWNYVPCLAYKIQKKGSPDFDTTAIFAAYADLAKNATKYNVTALNMSYGADQGAVIPIDLSDPEYIALKKLSDAGIILVASRGNASNNNTSTPAAYPNVLAVSATGPSPSQLAYYSSFGVVDPNRLIAAPGGDQTNGDANGILSLDQGNKYQFAQGTSAAAPFVTGVAGLLRSVPGVDYTRALNALLNQANHSITGQTSVPDQKFGQGLLDAYASLVSVSNVVSITDPQGVDPSTNTSTAPSQSAPQAVETFRPLVRFEVSNAKVVNGVPQVNVSLTTPSGSRAIITNGVPDTTIISNYYAKDLSPDPSFSKFDISFRYLAAPSVSTQQQQITVVSTPSDSTLTPAAASLSFNVTPHVFPAGVSFVSFPVVETQADSPTGTVRDVKAILGTNSAILYRWINAPVVDSKGKQTVQGQYAISGAGTADTLSQFATLHPSDITTTPTPVIDPRDNPGDAASTTTDATPAGLGYFLNLTAGAAVQSYGRTFTQQTIRVPLHEGWNMIGDPFEFPIAFSNLTFQAPNGTIYASSDAANSKLVLPFIYRFVGNDYEFQALPNGTLYPWEGNWIYVIPKDPTSVSSSAKALTLVMTPTQAGTARGVRSQTVKNAPTRALQSSTARPEVRGPGSWALRLVARSNNLVDGHNYIGMSSTAKDDDDLTKAPKPPRVGSNVMLGIQRGTQNGLYAQDLRSLGGTKTWNVVVTTDQPNADVSLSWPDSHALPRNYQFTLKDTTTGQVVDIRNRSTFQFNSGPKTQAREFTITAQPGNSGDHVVFNNVFVTQRGLSKATGQSTYQIDYNVSHDAQIDVSILNPGGRVISQLDSGRAASSGDNHIVWNGRDNQNHSIPAGAYIVRFRAVSSEGRVTQYHYPLTITGR